MHNRVLSCLAGIRGEDRTGLTANRALIVLALVIACHDWQAWASREHLRVWDSDLVNQVLTWFDFQAREWHSGRWAVWDPYLWMGQPLAGQAQPGYAYPLNRLLFALPLEEGHIRPLFLGLYFVAIHWIAAACAFVLLRGLGSSPVAAACGAGIWALGGFMATVSWPQWLNGACWAPLVLHFLIRAVHSEPWKNGAAAGLACGMSWLSGHHQAPVLLTLAAIGWLAWSVGRRSHRARSLRAAGTFLSISFLIGAAQILPGWDHGRDTVRWIGTADPVSWNAKVPYSAHEPLAIPPSSIAAIFLPGQQRPIDPFLGVAAAGLCLVGLRALGTRRASAAHIYFAILGLVALLFSLGDRTPLHGILYSLIPGLHRARWPSGVLFLTNLSIAVFASVGLDRILRSREPLLTRAASRGWLGFGAVLAATLTWLTWTGNTLEPRLGLAAVIAFATSAVLAASISSRATAAAFGLLLFAELSANAGIVSAPAWDPGRNQWWLALRAGDGIARFLKSQPVPFRVELPGSIAPNWGSWHGIETWHGYLPAISQKLFVIPWNDPRVRAMWGLRYTIAREPTRADQREVFRDAGGMRVFENPSAYPRVWFEGGSNCAANTDVRILARTPVHLRLSVKSACGGTVVVSETFHPDWRARVDGASTTVVERHGAMRSVEISVGERTVEFTYEPWSVRLGAVLSVLGCVAAGVIIFRSRR